MRLIDTHCHIYCEEFDADRHDIITRAVDAGVEQMLLPAIDSQSHDFMVELALQSPNHFRAMMGLHPTSVNDNPKWKEEIAMVEKMIREDVDGKFCALGEIGMDLYWSRDFEQQQTEAFEGQIDLALEHCLPIVVHVREAWPQTLTTMAKYATKGLKGVFHAFSGDVNCYKELLQYGDFVFGIGGVVTFKKNALAQVVEQMDIQHIVLETDAPYLTPTPHRGKRNEPAYITLICNKIAEIKGLTPEQVAAQTTANAERIFSLKNRIKQ